MIEVPFFSLLFSFGMSVKGLALALFKSKMIREGFSSPLLFISLGEVLFVFHEFDFHIHLAACVLNLAQEEQVFDKREYA